MPTDFVLTSIATGVLTGLVYGLAALGLSVIFGVMRIVNFAHGEFMVLAMVSAVELNRLLGLDPLLAAPLVGAAMFFLGVSLHLTLVQRFVSAPDHQQFFLMVGVAMVVLNALLIGIGPDARAADVAYSFDAIELGTVLIDKVRLYAGAAALVSAAALFVFFRFSATGRAIRAAADNPLGALVIGLPIGRLYAMTFGLGLATVGVAGCLMALVVDVRPQAAPEYTLLGFVIVIVGGLGSAGGALLGGLVIGVSEAIAGLFVVASMKSLVSYCLLIVIILIRPHGILGRGS